MIIAKYLKSYKTIITLGVFVALIPLLGIPSWLRDVLTYVSGLAIAFAAFVLNRKPREITTFKESLIEKNTVGIVSEASSEVENDFSNLNKE